MAYTTTTRLVLQKAVPGTNQPFETTSINDNWDKIDADTVASAARLDAIESLNTTQSSKITAVENRATSLESRTTAIEAVDVTQNSAITALQAKTNSGTVYDSARISGRTIFAQSATPTALAIGDIWIQV